MELPARARGLRLRPGVIVRHRLGSPSANAGIDRAPTLGRTEKNACCCCCSTPDASAHIRGWLIAPPREAWTWGRHHRQPRPPLPWSGTVGVAIGGLGLPALCNRRGEIDRYGYRLQNTDVGG